MQWDRRWIIGIVSALFLIGTLGSIFVGNKTNEKGNSIGAIEITDNLGGEESNLRLSRVEKAKIALQSAPTWGSKKAIGAKTKSDKKKKKLAEEKKKKKKKQAKKKKKKKKKIVRKKKVNPIPYEYDYQPETLNEEPIETAENSFFAGGGAQALSPEETTNLEYSPEINALIKYWRERIFKPSYEKLMDFITQRNAGLIPDEVFFALSEEMIFSNKKRLQSFGATALKSYPHKTSFELSTVALHEEELSQDARSILESSLRTYNEFKNLEALKGALASTENMTRFQSATYLGSSANYNLVGPGLPTDPDELSAYQESYRAVITSLDQAIAIETESSVASQLNTAKATIEGLLGSVITVSGF